jgi:hypothetical protein
VLDSTGLMSAHHVLPHPRTEEPLFKIGQLCGWKLWRRETGHMGVKTKWQCWAVSSSLRGMIRGTDNGHIHSITGTVVLFHHVLVWHISHSTPRSNPKSFFFFFWYWDLNSGLIPWATPPALFCDGFCQDRVSRIIYPGWLQTTILLISASW